LGLSQTELAKAAGVSLVALARLEAGMASPRLNTVSAIKEALNGAGIRLIDDDPEGGYTLKVSAQAVEQSAERLTATGE
jgi:transcriptional regulator with XRE-family HTH domain